MGTGEEVVEIVMRLLLRTAVEIDLAFDRRLAAAEALGLTLVDADSVAMRERVWTDRRRRFSGVAVLAIICQSARSSSLIGRRAIRVQCVGRLASTRMTCSRFGPWAPIRRIFPMSALRDGPVTKLTVRGMAPLERSPPCFARKAVQPSS
jgi:hypothetical protein